MNKILSIFLSAVLVLVNLSGSVLPANATVPLDGYVDGIEYSSWWATQNSVYGWVYDPSPLKDAVSVEVHVDGLLQGTIIPTIKRTDNERIFYINPSGVFHFALNNKWFDGKTHKINVYSVNSSTKKTVELGGSPLTFSLKDPGVTGYADAVELENGQRVARGWVFDNSRKDEPVNVVVMNWDYKIIGAGVTNVERPDVAQAFGVSGQQGFAIPINDTSDSTPHYARVFAIDYSLYELKLLGTLQY